MMEIIFPRYHDDSQDAAEIFVVHQLAQDFRQETDHRKQLEHHHRWYRQVSQQHQQEQAAMAKEANILAWFRQIWRSPHC